MASKISGLSGAPAPVGASRRAEKSRDATSGGSTDTAGSASSGDVQITSSASLLSSLEQQLHALPAVNEQRVAQLRNAIESGSYSVQPQHVADQLIQTEQTLAQISGG